MLYVHTLKKKKRQSAFIGLRRSHAIIGRAKFVYLTVLVQEPKMSDNMFYK